MSWMMPGEKTTIMAEKLKMSAEAPPVNTHTSARIASVEKKSVTAAS
jgi:hypothetical protein